MGLEAEYKTEEELVNEEIEKLEERKKQLQEEVNND